MSTIPAQASVMQLFVTEVYRTDFGGTTLDPLITQLERACRDLAEQDQAGQAWSDRNGYLGYTSYDSIDNLTSHAPVFAEMAKVIDTQVLIYSQFLEMDLRGRTPKMDRSWVNVLRPGGAHSGHIHLHSTFSGTLYISVPDSAGALQFEDPRLPQMMHAPLRYTTARLPHQIVAPVSPVRGTLLLWESWLRHEVPTNLSDDLRISISFNYDI